MYGNGEQQKSINLFGRTGINICCKRQYMSFTLDNELCQSIYTCQSHGYKSEVAAWQHEENVLLNVRNNS